MSICPIKMFPKSKLTNVRFQLEANIKRDSIKTSGMYTMNDGANPHNSNLQCVQRTACEPARNCIIHYTGEVIRIDSLGGDTI